MEKQTAGIRKFNYRLLKALCLLLSFAFTGIAYAQNSVRISWDYIRSLRIKPAQEYYFSATDGQFYLDIEGVSPEDVTISVERLPESVSFVSSRKETLLAKPGVGRERNGTRIIIWLRFQDPGTYKIPALYVHIGLGLYTVPYEQVTVYTNPRTIQPKVSMEFEENYNIRRNAFSVNAGDHIRFTVNLQYAVQMLDFKWSIPEDSIFKEIERYAVTENGSIGTTFSPDAVPVIKFDWQPLKSGTYKFPKILVNATSYSGSTNEYSPEEYTVTVKEASFGVEEEDYFEDDYAYAFESPAYFDSEEEVKIVELPNLQELLEYRIKERNSMPFFSSARKERIELESSVSLGVGESEPSLPVLYILIGFAVLFLAAGIVLIVFKKIPWAALCISFTLISLSGAVVQGVRCYTEYGLFTGGEISSIPEENIVSGVSISSGSRVRIAHKVKGWVYIVYNDTSGWVQEDRIYLIR